MSYKPDGFIVDEIEKSGKWLKDASNSDYFLSTFGGFTFCLIPDSLINPYKWEVSVTAVDGRFSHSSILSDDENPSTVKGAIVKIIKNARIMRELIHQTFKMQPDFYTMEQLILAWAWERDFFTDATAEGQAEKTVEEANETLEAVRSGNRDEIIDGLGDTLVTLIVQAKMHNLDLIECLRSAYLTIADRTGRMVNGVFVKDGQ